jgi:hypothetical protein
MFANYFFGTLVMAQKKSLIAGLRVGSHNAN